MADTEILAETASLNMDDIKKISGTEKIKAINGVSLEDRNDKEANMENGNITPCKSPQLNGDISDKSPTANDSESKEIILKTSITENKSIIEIEKNSVDKISNNHSNIKSDVDKCDESTTRSNISDEIIKSELNDVEVSEEAMELTPDTTKDIDSAESVKTCGNDENKNGVKEGLVNSDDNEDCQSSGSINCRDKNIKMEGDTSESKVDIETEIVKEESKDNEEISVVDKDKSDKLTEKSPTKRAKKNEPKVDLPKRITRSSSGISKAVKYSDTALLSYDDDDDDDDIKITKEVKKREDVKKKDEESDIEMIEECDPLAISDADVIKAKEAVKEQVGVASMKPLLKTKQSKTLGGPKKDSNVIIIDTNTLLKQQVSIAAASHTTPRTTKVPSVSASAQTTCAGTTITPAVQIQNAIQAITGGNPAIQGLQSAYLSAIQQVLIAQGGGQVSNPHYLAQLQQYYNTLGALQDDAYVIEAPSFIVPYVMEGKPVESIKEYLEKVNKEYAENEKKKIEGEKKEQEENDKKEDLIDDTKINEENKKKDPEDEKTDSSNDAQDSESTPMEVTETNSIDKDKLDESPSKEKIETTASATDKSENNSKEEDNSEDKKGISEKTVAKETNETDKSTTEKESDSKSELGKKENSGAEIPVSEETKEVEEKENEKSAVSQDDTKQNKSDEKSEVDKEDNEINGVSKTCENLEKVTKSTSSNEDDNKENKSSAENKTSKKEEEIIVLDKEEEIVKKECFKHLGRWESYYKSALGRFFLDLGLNHAQEFIQADLLKMQKRKLEKMKTHPSKQDIVGVKVLESQLKSTKRKNEHLNIPLKTCKFCSFKTESQLVMERHLESPHMINYTYKCNFCEFETRAPQVILFHTEAEHNVRGRLERAPAFFQCAICPYEDNNKSKMTRHALSCIKKFKPEKNSDLSDWEPPAKIPKIQRGRPNSFTKTFESLKMPNVGMMPKNLSGLGLTTIQTALSGGLLSGGASSHVNSLVGRGRGRPVGSYKTISQTIGVRTNNASMMYQNRATAGLLQPISGVTSQQLSLANQVLQSVSQGGNRVPRILPTSGNGSIIPGLAASSSITIQSVQNKTGSSKSPQQPSISITPLPRGGSQPSNTKSSASSNSARPAFVICEICDGYIKDLEQLRNHMNLIHKVKIHPKMIYNRPPLNCQKCQHRFFTDQGLERHLLGTHGLVTSSMQEAANKGKDAGRCPICGKVFQWKLLNHVSRDHKMTLKPAHLSYKCTVCTATFNMYRLFENHVYSAHSVVNKNKNNENVVNNSTAVKKPTDLTPMKINDEITIIPQPASKITKPDGKPSPKKSESPSLSKEITITKVGTSSRRRSGGGGVEVISLDDSPQKRQLEEAPKKKSRETSTSKRARTSS